MLKIKPVVSNLLACDLLKKNQCLVQAPCHVTDVLSFKHFQQTDSSPSKLLMWFHSNKSIRSFNKSKECREKQRGTENRCVYQELGFKLHYQRLEVGFPAIFGLWRCTENSFRFVWFPFGGGRNPGRETLDWTTSSPVD